MDFGPEDGICDPDLEARLYAEIHYSNETYPDHNVNNLTNINNSLTSSTQFESQSLDKNNASNSKRNYNWIVDTRTGNTCSTPWVEPDLKSTNVFRKPYCAPKDDYQLPHGHQEAKKSQFSSCNDERSSRLGRKYNDTPRSNSYLRLDTRKSDRLRSEHSDKFQRQKNGAKLKRQRQRVKKITAIRRGPLLNNVNDLNPIYIDDILGDRNAFNLLKNGSNSENNSVENCQRENWLNEQSSIMEEDIMILSKNTMQNTKNVHDNSTVSKYNISEKNIKLQKSYTIKNQGNDNESDSDDSIWEVPVPPKPTPPLINLRESDESSSDEKDVSQVAAEKDSSMEIVTQASTVLSEKSNTNQSYTTSADETIEIIENSTDSLALSENIILNCTTVQKEVSTLEDIKLMRKSAASSTVHDTVRGDSTTESEVMNWIEIDDQVFEERESQKENNSIVDGEPWQNFDNSIENHMFLSDNSLGDIDASQNLINVTKENLVAQVQSPVAIQSPEVDIVRQSDLVQNEGMNPIKTTEIIKKRKRTDNFIDRSKNDENTAKSLNPEKRQKKNEVTTAGMSFEKYIFQPLPENIISYYNDYQSSIMIMEVSEIQSRMSRHPSHWAILDADMIGSRRKGARNTCSSCQREGHRKERCPEKSAILSCRMCGEVGHKESTCPSTMCLTCGRKYTTYRKTCQVCKLLRCVTCKGLGHDKTQCPDLWRKYHMTITGTTPSIPDGHRKNRGLKSSAELYCCNCTKRGHDYSDCMKYRWSQHFVTPSFVTSYINGPCYETSKINGSNSTEKIYPTNEKIPNIINNENQDKTPINEKTSDEQINLHFHKLPVQQKKAVQLNQQLLPLDQAVANMTSKVIEAIRSVIEHIPSLQPQQPVREKKCIFQYGSCNTNPSEWHSSVINLEEGIQYPYNKNNEPAIPKFLEIHIPRNVVSLEVVISQYLDATNDFEITMRSLDSTLLTPLKLLMIQWMCSSEEDRLIVENTPVLPFSNSELRDALIKKMSLFAALTMRKGYSALTEIRNFKCQLLKGLNKRKDGKNDEELYKLILLRKEILVASVYNYNLNSNGKKIIQEVQKIIQKLKKNNIEISPLVYINCLWYNFELFTGHTRSYIVDVAENWKTLASDKLTRKSLKGISATVKKDQFGRDLRMKMRREARDESRAAQVRNKLKKSKTKHTLTEKKTAAEEHNLYKKYHLPLDPDIPKDGFFDNNSPKKKIKKKKKLNKINQVSGEVEIIVIDDDDLRTNENPENIQDSCNITTDELLSVKQQKSTLNSVSTQLIEKTQKKTPKRLKKSNKQMKDHRPRGISAQSEEIYLNSEQQSNDPNPSVLSNTPLIDTRVKNSNMKKKSSQQRKDLLLFNKTYETYSNEEYQLNNINSGLSETLEAIIETPKKLLKSPKKLIRPKDAEQFKNIKSIVSKSLKEVKDTIPSETPHESAETLSSRKEHPRNICLVSSEISHESSKTPKKKLSHKRKADSQLLQKPEVFNKSTSNDEFQIIESSRPKKFQESTETISKSPKTLKKSLREKKNSEQFQLPKESIEVHPNNGLETLTPEVYQKQILNQDNNQQQLTKQSLNKYNGVKVEITDLPFDLPKKHDKSPMVAPLILKLALAGADYIRNHNLKTLEQCADKTVENARFLVANKNDINTLWSRIIAQIKHRAAEGQQPGTTVFYPPQPI